MLDSCIWKGTYPLLKYIRTWTAAALTGSLLLAPTVITPAVFADTPVSGSGVTAGQIDAAALEQQARAQLQLSVDHWKVADSKRAFGGIDQVRGRHFEFEGISDTTKGTTISTYFDSQRRLTDYRRNNHQTTLGTVAHADAMQQAKSWVQRFLPDYAGQLVLTRDGYGFGTHSFYFQREVNGATVQTDSVQVLVNHAGEVEQFTLTNWETREFPGTEKAISPEQAKQIYSDSLDLRLRYYFGTDGLPKLTYSPY
ncbi:YcdB/YcdC domain-containing protein [Tumebacillus flagellatus]|uniref:YcdB/YcdC repeated domain-containing protein n=1 Tax=Tumebacillus flagellatus TaxID=1157490 RepID=A0A074LP80_9BACL|nr:YcdB/YcdC domain-containing protein [Tumebacillus flagellatus]KEO81608.1 hypothetical protein EL26_19730 [Tumebacillus flagellatus]